MRQSCLAAGTVARALAALALVATSAEPGGRPPEPAGGGAAARRAVAAPQAMIPAPQRRPPRRRGLRRGERPAAELTVLLPGAVPLELVLIRGGTPFTMGASRDQRAATDYEWPPHQVTISRDFYLGRTEVTQAQWQAVMGSDPSAFSGCGATCPVEMVSWTDVAGAGGFLERLNLAHGTTAYRLPTEAEWEYAARAGTVTRYSHGDVLECGDLCERCATHAAHMWWCGNAGSTTHPVGEKPPNPWGLFDMHGNVWEWVADWYSWYTSAPQVDPQGRATGRRRVVRGVSWAADAGHCRSSRRFYSVPGYAYDSVGFRLAMSL